MAINSLSNIFSWIHSAPKLLLFKEMMQRVHCPVCSPVQCLRKQKARRHTHIHTGRSGGSRNVEWQKDFALFRTNRMHGCELEKKRNMFIFRCEMSKLSPFAAEQLQTQSTSHWNTPTPLLPFSYCSWISLASKPMMKNKNEVLYLNKEWVHWWEHGRIAATRFVSFNEFAMIL